MFVTRMSLPRRTFLRGMGVTVALPLLTAYALARHAPRPLRRLYERREASYEALRSEYLARQAEGAPDPSARKKS